jgi:hypothetical protein
VIKSAHLHLHYGHERYGLAFVEGNVVLGEGAELGV